LAFVHYIKLILGHLVCGVTHRFLLSNFYVPRHCRAEREKTMLLLLVDRNKL
jgi:hypothetical protein